MQPDSKKLWREVYPQFSEEQLAEAQANLRAYLGVLMRIAERISAEGKSITDLAGDEELTADAEVITIQGERSNP